MSKTLLALVCPVLLFAQKTPFSTSTSQPVSIVVSFDGDPAPPSASVTTLGQLVVLKSAQPQTYQISAISKPQWLQYAVAPSSAQDCKAVPLSSYSSSVSSPGTGNIINLCIRAMSTPPLFRGNYPGTITVAPASGSNFVPFHLVVGLSLFPNGYLQLYDSDNNFLNAPTISNIAVANGSLALSLSKVVCHVFDPTGGTHTDLNDTLTVSAVVPGGFDPANWVLATFDKSTPPATLTISIDPAKAKNQSDLSAVVLINSLTHQGNDFVYLKPDLITAVVPALSASPNPINLSAVAGSNTLVNQPVMVSSSGGNVSYTAAATTSDGGNWLSIMQPTGTTPGAFTLVLDPSHLVAKTYMGTVTITASGASNSPLSIQVTATAMSGAPTGPVGQTLVSGVPIVVNLPGEFKPTLFNGASSDQIMVPQGATSLQLQIQTTGDVGLYARYGSDVGLDANGQIVADASAPAAGGGNQSITLTPGSSPPLRAGLWYVSLSNLLNVPAQVTLTATITSAAPAPNNLTVSPNPLTANAVAGSTTLITNTVNIASTTAGLSFGAAVTSGSWLSVQNVSGTTPGTFSAVIDPSKLSSGSNSGSIQVTAGGAANSPVTLAVNVQASTNLPLPSIKSGGIVNAASNTAPIAPGSWVSIYGSNLSPQVPSGIDWNGAIINNKLPLVLAGVSVTIDNNPAAISFVNNNQINVQAPSDSNSGPVNVVVATSNGVSAPGVVTLQPIAPALFMNGASMYPAAQFADYSTVSSTHPAHPGDAVILYGTGFGPTSPAYSTGVLLSGSAPLTNAVTATVGNIPAQVGFAGIIAPGLYQININVPASAGTGDQPLALSINGLQTQGNVFIPVVR